VLLAIDTATTSISIALYDGQIRSEYTWLSDRNHNTELIPKIDALLVTAKVHINNLKAVAVTIGPGSFTGVRVGVTTAKTVSYSLGLPVIGVGTLEVAAYPHFQCQEVAIRPLVEAGRGRYCTCTYMRVDNFWKVTEEPYIISPYDLPLTPVVPTLFCGEMDSSVRAVLAGASAFVRVVTPSASARRAGYLAEIGWNRLQDGEVCDPADLQAIYLSRTLPLLTER
jgi:tRNA threonylcarbamoyladenosine biosynthesis protein TsaB